MTICYIMNRFLGMFLKGGKVDVVRYCHRKFKCEQVIILQMTQQLKIKNINVVPGQLLCCLCKAKFLSETDSVY